MPYTASDAPEHVKKLPAKKQRQWLHIFNGCTADGKPESKCFKMANGVAMKDFMPELENDPEVEALVQEAKDYQYIASYEYEERQVPQNVAGYDPLGASASKGCANCQFFISPSRCALVAGTISPTGVSNFWHERMAWTPEPIPVTIVGGAAKSTTPSEALGSPPATTTLLGGLRNLLRRHPQAPPASPVQARAFTLTRQKDGRTRFYTVWSNNFKDREGEIFTAAAHKEFVDWATKKSDYPELWLWHTKGSRFGQVDWLDNTGDGFVHASGLIDSGKEAIAEQVAKEDSGVSHGFWGLQKGNIIHWYRSYELSVLPIDRAAVPTTSFNILRKGKEMAFTAEKRKYFQDLGIPEDDIKAWEGQTDGLAEALKAAGLESKAADLGIDTPPPPTPEQVTEANFRVETTKALQTITELVSKLAHDVKDIQDKTKDIKSGDAVVAAAMTPQNASAVQASKSNDNIVPEDARVNDKSKEFFESTILGGLLGTPAQV